MDQASLWIIKATIYEIEEVSEKEFFKVSSFYYKVLLQRNDGLEWRIRKRYSDFRSFRKRIIKIYEKVVFYTFSFIYLLLICWHVSARSANFTVIPTVRSATASCRFLRLNSLSSYAALLLLLLLLFQCPHSLYCSLCACM